MISHNNYKTFIARVYVFQWLKSKLKSKVDDSWSRSSST